MSLTNSRSILRQIILLFNSLRNLSLMIFRHNRFFGIAFLTAVLSISLNFWLVAIAMLFCCGLIMLANNFDWQNQAKLKNSLTLVSLLLICLVLPQVETNMANFTSPIERLENKTLRG